MPRMRGLSKGMICKRGDQDASCFDAQKSISRLLSSDNEAIHTNGLMKCIHDNEVAFRLLTLRLLLLTTTTCRFSGGLDTYL